MPRVRAPESAAGRDLSDRPPSAARNFPSATVRPLQSQQVGDLSMGSRTNMGLPPMAFLVAAGFALTRTRPGSYRACIETECKETGMTICATWTFNGKTRVILGNWHRLWVFIFWPFYYFYKGMFLWALLALFTINGCGLMILYNRTIVMSHFFKKGWVQE